MSDSQQAGQGEGEVLTSADTSLQLRAQPTQPSHDGEAGKEDTREERSELFPDGGWGWVVAAGCYVIAALVNTIGPCFGILFSRFLLDLGTSTTVVAWIFNTRAFVLCVSQLLLGPMLIELGWRPVAFVSGLLVAIGMGISAYAYSATYLLFSYSLITGIGSGLEVLIVFSIIPHYFKRRRGRANAIMQLGITTGQMAGPILITHLQHQYAFRGSILVLSAIMLNCCVGAAVFHPVEWHVDPACRQSLRKGRGAQAGQSGTHGTCLRVLQNIFNSLKLLRHPQVVILAIGSSLNTSGFLNFLMLVPFALQSSGFSLEEAAWCVSVAGLCNLLARLLVSTITDIPRVSLRLCYMAGTAVAFFATLGFSVLKDLMVIAAVMGVWGCGVGAFMSLHSLIMVQYVGLNNLVQTMGVCSFFNGFVFILVGPLLGVIRDATNSYSAAMWMLAANFGLSFILYLGLPWAVAWDRDNQAKSKPPDA